jgi:hypothetical protein
MAGAWMAAPSAAAYELARDEAYREHDQDESDGLSKPMRPRTATAGTPAFAVADRTHGGCGGRLPALFSYNHNFLLFILLAMLYD